ncbi:MAG: hypothetical protein ACN2B6_12650 [Rickettsiales bacterium]
MSISPKLQSRLDKLLKLVEQGVGGERDNAMARLEGLCKKHGVDMQELMDGDDHKEMYWFRYDNPYVHRMLRQLAYQILGWDDYCTYKNRYKQRQMGVELTKSQHAEFTIYYEAYRAALKQQLDDVVGAFIAVNNIYPPAELSRPDEDDDRDIDWDKLDREAELASAMSRTHVHKRLEK